MISSHWKVSENGTSLKKGSTPIWLKVQIISIQNNIFALLPQKHVFIENLKTFPLFCHDFRKQQKCISLKGLWSHFESKIQKCSIKNKMLQLFLSKVSSCENSVHSDISFTCDFRMQHLLQQSPEIGVLNTLNMNAVCACSFREEISSTELYLNWKKSLGSFSRKGLRNLEWLEYSPLFFDKFIKIGLLQFSYNIVFCLCAKN